MVAAGVAIAALALSVMSMLAAERRDLAPTTSPASARPVAARGCLGCLLASEAGDAYLSAHLAKECAA